MKFFPSPALLCVLAVVSGGAMATSGSLNEFRPKVMPVLVQVNSHGKVTDASPAVELSPRLNRLLLENLDELISKPATDKHGRPVSSQFVINLALQVSPRKEGDYDAQFAYVSTTPVPSGSWYWVHIDGHRLALASRNSFNRSERIPYYRDRGMYRPMNNRSYQPASIPHMQDAARGASRAPAPGHGR